MDEQHNPLKSELKFLERLSIEELEALLKLSGDPDDVELLFDTVVEEVVAREKENPTGRLPDVDTAWDELQMLYQNMPVEERLPLPLSEGISSAGDHGSTSLASSAGDKPRRVSFRNMARTAAIMAAAVVLCLALMVGAQAAGADVFGALARWTDDTFHFETRINGNDQQTIPHGISPDSQNSISINGEHIPLKFPNGFVLIEASATQSEDKISVQASFSNEDNKYFYIRIDQFNQQEDIDFQTFEIEGDSVIEYSSHGKEFFIFSNYDTTTATWNDGSSTLQRIWGELTKEELKTIIDVMEEFK
ncbi:MAG: hypothetical protein HFF20_04465 [Oscillospiraceae bacterium]|nr:hypothetical protein [Oscillospiraceae bacterium]